MHRIILHANRDEGFDIRVEAAMAIARVFNAHITCLHSRQNMTVTGDVYAAGMFTAVLPSSIEEDIRKEEQAFRDHCSRMIESEDVSWDWKVRLGLPERAFARESVLGDLVILSPAGEDIGDQSGETFLGRTLVAAGCPVLVAPRPEVRFATEGRVLLLWNGSPEAGRALKGAMPFLKRAAAVRILGIGEARSDRPGPEDAARYLSRANIRAETREVADGDAKVIVQEEAAAFEADLIVMGAYGRSRFSELILGGVTQSMISQTRHAILFAH